MRRANKRSEARRDLGEANMRLRMLSRFKRRPRPNAKAGTSEIRRWLIGRELFDETR
jgi:hypothetical protein